jgi:hypothetical protein
MEQQYADNILPHMTSFPRCGHNYLVYFLETLYQRNAPHLNHNEDEFVTDKFSKGLAV